jgi:Protein of unknown function (DUF742)
MSGTADDEFHDGPQVGEFARPFLARQASTGPVSTGDEDSAMRVRPYLLTGGRVRPVGGHLGFETMLTTTPAGTSAVRSLAFEQHSIAVICTDPLSVAEVSARLRIPIGVAQVLASEMAAAGYLTTSIADTPADDISLLTRLINGVRAL